MAPIAFVHWSLLIAAMTPYAVVVVTKATRDYDNADPRNPDKIKSPLRRRAYDAHQNCFEAFPFYAVAVLLALQRGVAPASLDLLAGLWLGFRIAYIAAYLGDRAMLRTLLWWGASICTIVIFMKALRP